MTAARDALRSAPRTHVLGAAGWLVFGAACFAVMDALTRLVGPAVSLAWIAVVRFAVHTLAMGGWLVVRRREGAARVGASPARTGAPLRLQVLRGVALFASSAFAVLALQGMPVAEYTAVIMLTPVIVTLLAGWVLRHRVGRAEASLVALSFVGALIAIRPGSGLFGSAAWFAFGVATCNALYQLSINHHSGRDDAVTTNFHTGWVGLVLALAWLALSPASPTAVDGASPWTLRVIALLLVMAVLATAAQLAVIVALSRAPVAALMPFSYSQIATAALAGWVILGAVPDFWSWVGMAVIGACGALAAWLHTRRRGVVRRVLRA